MLRTWDPHLLHPSFLAPLQLAWQLAPHALTLLPPAMQVRSRATLSWVVLKGHGKLIHHRQPTQAPWQAPVPAEAQRPASMHLPSTHLFFLQLREQAVAHKRPRLGPSRCRWCGPCLGRRSTGARPLRDARWQRPQLLGCRHRHWLGGSAGGLTVQPPSCARKGQERGLLWLRLSCPCGSCRPRCPRLVACAGQQQWQ